MASLGPAGTTESLMGHIYHKPYGYAGDFEIIDKLYTTHVSSNPMITRWDEFVQAVPSSQSVRNRGPYLRTIMLEMLATRTINCPLHVVSLGSGPGRDVEHALDGLLSEKMATNVRVTCIDVDERALAHSERVLARYRDRVRQIKADAIRFCLDEPADLIWSAGLFDYFSDRAFGLVLKRLLRSVAPGGRVVVGNFSERCGGHGPMAFVEWNLVVRSAAELQALAERAKTKNSRIDAEPVGLNLFLHLENGN